MTIAFQTNANQVNKATDITVKLLKNFSTQGMDKKTIDLTKQYLKGNFSIALSSNISLMNAVTNIAFYQRPLNYLDTYSSKIDQASDEQINKAIKKWYNPNNMHMVRVGPPTEKNKQ